MSTRRSSSSAVDTPFAFMLSLFSPKQKISSHSLHHSKEKRIFASESVNFFI